MPAADKPNILVIMGDDIGWLNPRCYSRGMMDYRTPNIGRIANEGAMFTVWCGQQSWIAGRAAIITGQSPIRTGLTKVGLPGADLGSSGRSDDRGDPQTTWLPVRIIRRSSPQGAREDV
jgi:arylsulfatase A-like enzyme